MPAKPAIDATRRAGGARSRSSGHDSATMKIGARNVIAEPPRAADSAGRRRNRRREDQHQRAEQLHSRCGAPEARPGAVPRERRDEEHLSRVARPHDEQQRVVANEILGRRIERRQAQTGEQEQRQRVRERASASRHKESTRGRAAHAPFWISSRSTKGRMPPCR